MAGRKPRVPRDEQAGRAPLRGVPAPEPDEADAGPAAAEAAPRVKRGGRKARGIGPAAGSGINPETGEWTPAYPGQRPPFQPGHEVNLVHGARSERRLGPRAAEIEADMLADPDLPDHVRAPAFRAQARLTSRALAIFDLMFEWASGMDADQLAEPRGKSGQGKPAIELVMQAQAKASTQLDKIALSVPSYARTRKDLGIAQNNEEAALGRMAREGAALTARQADVIPALTAGDDDEIEPDEAEDGPQDVA